MAITVIDLKNLSSAAHYVARDDEQGTTTVRWSSGEPVTYTDPDGSGWAAVEEALAADASVGAALNRHVRPLPRQ
jgi:hypothetical protein